MNLKLQRKDTDLGSLESNIQSTLAELRKLMKKPGGAYCKKIEERARQLNIVAPIGGNNDSFVKDARAFLDVLYENVSERLENLDIVTNLGILDLRKAPEITHIPATYGNKELMEIAEYFEIDEEDMINEWTEFKQHYLNDNFNQSTLSIQTLTYLINRLNITVGKKFPLIQRFEHC